MARARRFQARLPIVDSEGRPTPEFLRNLNEAVDLVNAVAAAQAAATEAKAAAIVAQEAVTTVAADVDIVDERTTSARQFLDYR